MVKAVRLVDRDGMPVRVVTLQRTNGEVFNVTVSKDVEKLYRKPRRFLPRRTFRWEDLA